MKITAVIIDFRYFLPLFEQDCMDAKGLNTLGGLPSQVTGDNQTEDLQPLI